MTKENWIDICSECGFYSNVAHNGRCHHPKNDKWTCLGFREDSPITRPLRKLFGKVILQDKCGVNAIYFEKATPESIVAIKITDFKILSERHEEIKKAKEFANRIETRLDNCIWKVLSESGLDICFCNHITFNYENTHGRNAIVNALLKEFDIKAK